MRVVEIVVEEARGKCGVIAHTGHQRAQDAIELTRHAQQTGADLAILMTPYYSSTNEDMIVNWFEYVAAQINIGVWLFDTPFSGRPVLTPRTIEKLSQSENVCGVKIARSLDHYLEVKRLCGNRLVLSTPSEAEFLSMMRDHGQVVHQSSASPYLIQAESWQPMRNYTRLGLEGRFKEAEVESKTLQSLRALVKSFLFDTYREIDIMPIAAIKSWSEMLGMAAGPVREPLLQMSEQRRSALRGQLERTRILARRQIAAA